MPNFVKIACQIKKCSTQEIDIELSVCMAAICYSGALSTVPTYEKLLEEKTTCTKFQIDISTCRQAGMLNQLARLIIVFIFFIKKLFEHILLKI